MFYRLQNSGFRYCLYILYVFGFVFALIGIWHQFPSVRKWVPENSSELASWLQAFGSVAAIIATGYLTMWQFKKNKKLLEDQKKSLQLDLCDICEQMCDAASSIINIKFNASGIEKIFNNFFITNPVPYHLNSKNFESINSGSDDVEDSVVYSLERIMDLQETLRILLSKDLPVSLMKSIFYLQKYIAQYKGFILRYANDKDLKEIVKDKKSKEFRYCRMILNNINTQKKLINKYREELKVG